MWRQAAITGLSAFLTLFFSLPFIKDYKQNGALSALTLARASISALLLYDDDDEEDDDVPYQLDVNVCVSAPSKRSLITTC